MTTVAVELDEYMELVAAILHYADSRTHANWVRVRSAIEAYGDTRAAEYKQDAERYRWVLDNDMIADEFPWCDIDPRLTTAERLLAISAIIDAAIRARVIHE